MTANDDSQKFDEAMRQLMKHLRVVIETDDKGRMQNTGVKPIMKYLNKYEKIYNHVDSDPDMHRDYFINVYKKFRTNILKGYKNDGWLTSNVVIIQFGEGQIEKVNKEIKIMLSTIYKTAVKLRDDANKRIADLPDEAAQACYELNYTDIFMLYLYRIFREVVTDKKDKETLTTIISEIEQELEVPSDSVVVSQQGLGGVLGNIAGLARSFGINIPSDFKIPSQEEVLGDVKKIVDDPRVKSQFGGLMQGLQSGNVNNVISAIKSQMSPEMSNMMNDLIGNLMSAAGPAVQVPTPIEDSPGGVGNEAPKQLPAPVATTTPTTPAAPPPAPVSASVSSGQPSGPKYRD